MIKNFRINNGVQQIEGEEDIVYGELVDAYVI